MSCLICGPRCLNPSNHANITHPHTGCTSCGGSGKIKSLDADDMIRWYPCPGPTSEPARIDLIADRREISGDWDEPT